MQYRTLSWAIHKLKPDLKYLFVYARSDTSGKSPLLFGDFPLVFGDFPHLFGISRASSTSSPSSGTSPLLPRSPPCSGGSCTSSGGTRNSSPRLFCCHGDLPVGRLFPGSGRGSCGGRTINPSTVENIRDSEKY